MNEFVLFDHQDLRQAIHTLADFVANDRARVDKSIVNALAIYASAAHQVNDRLRECCRLIKIGQRSEALRQVSMEPDALKMFNDLRFRKSEWLQEICEEERLKVPPKLDMESAKILEKAFNTELDNKDLLEQHRMLALERAPLARRLEVLRMIRKTEAREWFWQDDVISYEKQYCNELQQLLNKPGVLNDWDTINRLFREITATKWEEPFPLEISEQIKSARKRMQHRDAEQELQPYDNKLLDVMSNFIADVEDLERVKVYEEAAEIAALIPEPMPLIAQLIAKSAPIAKKYELKEGDELLRNFENASDWIVRAKKVLKHWKEFDRQVEQLQEAMDGGMEWYYVQELYRVVIQFGWDLPKKLLYSIQRRAKRRKLVLLGSIGLGVAAIAGAIVYFVVL